MPAWVSTVTQGVKKFKDENRDTGDQPQKRHLQTASTVTRKLDGLFTELTHDSEKNGSRDWIRVLYGPGYGGKFGIPESLCLLIK
jgi:hypothetical protein